MVHIKKNDRNKKIRNRIRKKRRKKKRRRGRKRRKKKRKEEIIEKNGARGVGSGGSRQKVISEDALGVTSPRCDGTFVIEGIFQPGIVACG